MENLKLDIEKTEYGKIRVWIQGGYEGSSLVGEYKTIDDALQIIKILFQTG